MPNSSKYLQSQQKAFQSKVGGGVQETFCAPVYVLRMSYGFRNDQRKLYYEVYSFFNLVYIFNKYGRRSSKLRYIFQGWTFLRSVLMVM